MAPSDGSKSLYGEGRFKLGEALKRYGLDPQRNFSGQYPDLVRGGANDIKAITNIHEWAEIIPFEISELRVGANDVTLAG